MIDVLPIRLLTEEDSTIFGSLAVNLAKLAQANFPVASGIVVAPLELKLRTILEHYDFGSKEVFEQSLTLVKKEIYSQALPDILQKETRGHKKFLLFGKVYNQKELWKKLLEIWIEELKKKLWTNGFYPGITQNLTPQIIIFVKKVESSGIAFFDPIQDDSVINIKSGQLHPNDLKKLDEIVNSGNKKLFLPYEYEWIVDKSLKLTALKPYTPSPAIPIVLGSKASPGSVKVKSTVKVFLDLSLGLVVEKDVDGIYISSEKIFDLNKPQTSFEELTFKLVESALTFPQAPVLFKLADKSEGMGKIRGTLRLLHQQSLLNPLLEAVDFARSKKGLNNIYTVVPFVRNVKEFLQIKKKLSKPGSAWLEVCVPENILNLEEYLEAGLNGVVLNLDELISHLNGFDKNEQELTFYKNEVKGLLKFLEDGLKILHKSKIPFISIGTLNLYPEVLEYLVEKGVFGIVLEKYEAHSAHEILHQAERRVVLRKVQQ